MTKSFIDNVTVPLCPHARPIWHNCPSCPQPDIQQPLQIEYPNYEYEERQQPEKEKDETGGTVIVIEF